jgi:hypothetical protein
VRVHDGDPLFPEEAPQPQDASRIEGMVEAESPGPESPGFQLPAEPPDSAFRNDRNDIVPTISETDGEVDQRPFRSPRSVGFERERDLERARSCIR